MSDRAGFPCVVHVLLRNSGGSVCLLRRANTGFMDGWYSPPGGHQEVGESVQDAAIRECLEETGVRPEMLQPIAVLPYRSGTHQGVNFVFACTTWAGDVKADPQVFDDTVWVNPDHLPHPCVPWLPNVLALEASNCWFEELSY